MIQMRKTRNMEKRILVKETNEIDLEIFTGKFKDLLVLIQEFIDKKWEGMELSRSYEYSEFIIYRYREENDEEYQTRIEKLKKQKIYEEKAKERRRKQYELLRKEFEDKP